MKFYIGTKSGVLRKVSIHDNNKITNLELPTPLFRHSLYEFNWGCSSFGCADLSSALLFDLTKNIEIVNKFHIPVAKYFIRNLPKTWKYNEEELKSFFKAFGTLFY